MHVSHKSLWQQCPWAFRSREREDTIVKEDPIGRELVSGNDSIGGHLYAGNGLLLSMLAYGSLPVHPTCVRVAVKEHYALWIEC